LSPAHHKRALHKEEINRLLSGQRGHFSWLNTKNRKLILTALEEKKKTVVLEGVSWKQFELRLNGDKVFVCPTGKNKPFGPVIWLDIDRLKEEVNATST
jgi:hypothetical protein